MFGYVYFPSFTCDVVLSATCFYWDHYKYLNEEIMSTGDIQAAVVLLSTALKAEISRKEKQRRKQRSVWVREWIKRRDTLGASSNLLKELRVEDPTSYRNILRMSSEQFNRLHGKVQQYLHKKNTVMRLAIPVNTKLEITLRYLATGDSLKSLEYLFRVPESTISKFLPNVLSAIAKVLKPYISVSIKLIICF